MSIPAEALDNLAELQTPPDEIQYRSGQKQHDGQCDKPCRLPHAQLAYVDARYVMRVLDTLVGPANWQRLHTMDGQKVACGIGIDIEGTGWVFKWDGAGETDIEGEKGSFSDAFKRAAVSWGIARDLYSMKPQASGQSAPRAATRPAPVSAQAGAGSLGPRETDEARARPGDDLMEGFDEDGLCPVHKKPWSPPTEKAARAGYGYGCRSKNPDGSWCQRKPSAMWAAAHEK